MSITMAEVEKILGHADIETTISIYDNNMKTKYHAIKSSEVENCTFDEIMEFQTEQERDQWVNAAKGREALTDMDFLGLDVDDYYRIPEGKHFRLIQK